MTREEVEALVLPVGAAIAVARARNDEQLEVLVVFDQLVDDLERRRGVDVLIHLADHELDLALQPVGIVDVR